MIPLVSCWSQNRNILTRFHMLLTWIKHPIFHFLKIFDIQFYCKRKHWMITGHAANIMGCMLQLAWPSCKRTNRGARQKSYNTYDFSPRWGGVWRLPERYSYTWDKLEDFFSHQFYRYISRQSNECRRLLFLISKWPWLDIKMTNW